jgi:hypothetical protein
MHSPSSGLGSGLQVTSGWGSGVQVKTGFWHRGLLAGCVWVGALVNVFVTVLLLVHHLLCYTTAALSLRSMPLTLSCRCVACWGAPHAVMR